MFVDLLVLFACCALTFGQDDATSLPSAADNIFLLGIVPLKVQRSLAGNGDMRVTIDLLYSENGIISWVAHGSGNTYMDEFDLRVSDTVPSEYTLELLIPREVVQGTDATIVDDDTGKQNIDGVIILEDGDFLVDFKELLIKFQTLTLQDAAVLKVSLAISEAGEEDNDKEHDADILDEDEPKFPEMMVLKEANNVVIPGARSLISLDVLFTDHDRYSVRGLLYNSSSNTIFTTYWSTDYFLGQSDFQKIGTGDDIVDFDQNVKLVDNFDLQESSSIRQILIDVPTDKGDISGIYTITAHHEAGSAGPELILESSLEQNFVILRAGQEHGPLPTGLLQFQGGSYSKIFCRLGPLCLVSCHVYGVGVQTLELMHKNAISEFKALPKEHQRYGPYDSDVVVMVDSTNPANSGTYLCKADSGTTSISKEIDVMFMAQ